MLSTNTTVSSFPLSDELSDKGLCIVPCANTILSKLVRATYVDADNSEISSLMENGDTLSFAAALEKSTRNSKKDGMYSNLDYSYEHEEVCLLQ